MKITGVTTGKQSIMDVVLGKNEKTVTAENMQDTEASATVQISEEAREKYQMLSMFQRQMEDMKEQRESASEYANDLAKIMTIFRRIAHGDIVPGCDERKLMEHSMELYQAAKMAATMAKNDDPKKYKSVDENEESETEKMIREALGHMGSSNSSETIVIKESAPVEAAEAPVAE